MTPQDPRHGTHRGYIVGCREDCCTAAHTVYMKLYRMGRRNRLVSPVGTIRRIEALQCLGWTMQEIALRCGFEAEWTYNLCRSTQITTRTAALVARAYDELSMQLPPERTQRERAAATKSRRRAAREGWAFPLSWDEDTIDDPTARPHGHTRHDGIDRVVVERILAGDHHVPATKAERLEVIARWTGSRNELARVTGWNVARDLRDARVAS